MPGQVKGQPPLESARQNLSFTPENRGPEHRVPGQQFFQGCTPIAKELQGHQADGLLGDGHVPGGDCEICIQTRSASG